MFSKRVHRLTRKFVSSFFNANSTFVQNQQLLTCILPSKSFCSWNQQAVGNNNKRASDISSDYDSDYDSDFESSELDSEEDVDDIMPFTAKDGKVFESKKLSKTKLIFI